MSEISTSPDIAHDHGHAQNVDLPYPVSSPDIDDHSDLPRITPRWRTIKWTPYRLFFPFSAILFGVAKFVLSVANYNVGSGVLELWFGVVLALVFWAGGLMEPAAPRVGTWGWFFHRNYGRVVRKVVWSISALCMAMLAPFWMVMKIASMVIYACFRSPVLLSDRWHRLEELENGHDHQERREPPSRSPTTTHHPHAHIDSLHRHPDPSHSMAELNPQWLDVAYSTTIYHPHGNNDSVRQRHPDPSHSRPEPHPQWSDVAYVSELEFPLLPSAAPLARFHETATLYLPDDMETRDLVPSLKEGRCKSVRSKRAPGGRRVSHLGRRAKSQLY